MKLKNVIYIKIIHEFNMNYTWMNYYDELLLRVIMNELYMKYTY